MYGKQWITKTICLIKS